MKKKIIRVCSVLLLTGLMIIGTNYRGGSSDAGSDGSGTASEIEPGNEDEVADEVRDSEDHGSDVIEAGQQEEMGSGEVEMADVTDQTDVMKKTAEALNRFNWNIFKETEIEDNLFYSPYSLASAITLADLGAAGSTKSEIEEMLGISDCFNFAEGLRLFREKDHGKSRFTDANAIWLDNALELSDNYEQVFREPAEYYFDGEIRQGDFANQSDAIKSEIKGWVSEKTDGMISDFEPAVSEETIADILNAVYFYGEWRSPFEAHSTFEDVFHGIHGDRKTDLMHQDNVAMRYVENEQGIRAAAMPYSDGSLEMDFFIPAPETEDTEDVHHYINGLWEQVDQEKLFEALDQAPEKEISYLVLPKFTMDLTFDDIADILKKLGMKSAFTDGADFSFLAKDMKVSSVTHRAKIEVDEEGSRAAAVTEITMEKLGMALMEDYTEFIVNEPFIYVIRDRESGLILFTGRVNDLED